MPSLGGEIPRRSTLDWSLEVIAAVALAALLLTVWIRWPELPVRVPRHFNLAGKVNGWGSKSDLWSSCLTAAGVWALLTVIDLIVSRIPIRVKTKRGMTEERAQRIERGMPEFLRLQRGLLLWIKALAMLTSGYAEWSATEAALGRLHPLGEVFMLADLVAFPLVIVVYLVRIERCRRAW